MNIKVGIYQFVISQINLDFNETRTTGLSAINSSYSSPIIERVNIDNLFSNAITSTSTVNDTISNNSLVVQTQGLYNNRNYVIIDSVLMNKPRGTELLNYQSNILYCIINGLSPSIY
jgi:hypothetical protein